MMRVALNRDLYAKDTGPLLFSRRLMERLTKFGVKVVPKSAKPHIYFAVIHLNRRDIPRGAKSIVRVDGIYWSTRQHSIKNNGSILDSVRTADGVVYQSDFCKRCCEANGGIAKQYAVILNGIDKKYIQKIKPANLSHTPGLVACAQWRATKRPKSICKGFLASDIPHHLYMIGQIPRNAVFDERITWMGDMSPERAIGVMKACTHAVHMSKFDPCPNAVVEEVMCGLPVLHTANGGVPEIVADHGLKMDVDSGWNYKPLDGLIDNINPKITARYLSEFVKMGHMGPREELDMDNIAKQYFEFFSRVLST